MQFTIKGYLFYVTVWDISGAIHKGISCTVIIFRGHLPQVKQKCFHFPILLNLLGHCGFICAASATLVQGYSITFGRSLWGWSDCPNQEMQNAQNYMWCMVTDKVTENIFPKNVYLLQAGLCSAWDIHRHRLELGTELFVFLIAALLLPSSKNVATNLQQQGWPCRIWPWKCFISSLNKQKKSWPSPQPDCGCMCECFSDLG